MGAQRHHDWIDQRSLAMAQAIAVKLTQSPDRFAVVVENLARWKNTMSPWPPALREWEDIVAQGQKAAVAALVEDTPRGRRLRQSHPFAGVLTPSERNGILRQYESISA